MHFLIWNKNLRDKSFLIHIKNLRDESPIPFEQSDVSFQR
jgi:hypothetical protein